MKKFEILRNILGTFAVLYILLVVAVTIFPNFFIGKEAVAQIHAENLAKEKTETDQFFAELTQDEWVVISGKLTENGGVHYIIRSKPIGRAEEHIRGFDYLPPNIKIGDQIRLERKQGASDPYNANSFNIIPVKNRG